MIPTVRTERKMSILFLNSLLRVFLIRGTDTKFSISLSPFDLWPIALVAPVALFWLTRSGSTWRTVLRFYLFNLGMFAVGVSWIFVSIHNYGGASVPLAAILVGSFVAACSLVCVPLAYLYARYFRDSDISQVLGFVA